LIDIPTKFLSILLLSSEVLLVPMVVVKGDENVPFTVRLLLLVKAPVMLIVPSPDKLINE